MTSSAQGSLWSAVDERRARGASGVTADPPPSRRRFRWALDAVLPLALTTVVGVAVLLPDSLPAQARVALFGFAFATILWSTTSLNSAYVALVAVVLVILAGGGAQEQLFDSLASDVIWLMIGAFVLGGAMRQTGLAGRLTRLVMGRAKTVAGVFWLATTVLLPLSFFIPSTSGRAAVVMPAFRSLVATLEHRKITRALGLLMPTVILVATISTLIGAASHLIAVDLLDELTGQRISFAQWALWGLPFGVVASFVSCWVVLHLFLDRELRSRRVPERADASRPRTRLSRDERMTLAVLAVLVAAWLTEARHGLDAATVTVIGALLLTLPRVGVMRWKDGLAAVSWNLIVFVGAALALGRILIESGAGQWIIDNLFVVSGVTAAGSTLLALLLIGLLSLTSHLYMTSHTVRAVALVPPFLYLAQSLGLDATAVVFIATVGMDYCLTLPVSSKAILLFQETDVETFHSSDLLRLSAVLMPVHMLLIVLFYYGYWQWTGLAL